MYNKLSFGETYAYCLLGLTTRGTEQTNIYFIYIE